MAVKGRTGTASASAYSHERYYVIHNYASIIA